MPIDPNAAIDQYGPMAQIVQAVPELRDLMTQAVANSWSPDRLKAAVQASPWYLQHSATASSLLMTQAAHPAEYQQQLDNQTFKIAQMARTMGITVEDPNSLALQSLLNGWDDQRTQVALGERGWVTGGQGGARVGSVAQYQDRLMQTFQSYGVPYTQDYLDTAAKAIAAGDNTLDGYVSIARNQAKAQYPQYAAQLDQGQTMVQIADPYMAQMAKTLELNQNSVTLNDPYVQKALSVRDPQTGAVTSQSMWQFTQNLKADPRYDRTTQAKTDAYNTLAQIGKDFGFSSGTSAPGASS